MECPNCGKQMKIKHYYHTLWCTGDEPDYDITEYREYHYCPTCKIKYENDEWEIPDCYSLATNKQKRCIAIINDNLGTNFEPVLKQQCWKIINEYYKGRLNNESTFKTVKIL